MIVTVEPSNNMDPPLIVRTYKFRTRAEMERFIRRLRKIADGLWDKPEKAAPKPTETEAAP